MAKVVKVKSQLRSDKNKMWFYTLSSTVFAGIFLGFGLVILTTVLMKKSTLPLIFPIIFIILGIVLLLIFRVNRKRYGILKSGVEGEKAALEILKKLPKDFTVITNPVICNRGSINELDFVVVGKNGVFIVEAKNYRGIIKGKTSEQKWHKLKHTKNGKVYEKEIENPVRQSYRQSRRMREVFIDFDITADIYPIVFFTDSKSVLKVIEDSDMNVVLTNDADKLLDYIINTKGTQTVNSDELKKIKRFFNK